MLKVSELKHKVDSMPQDKTIAVTYITEDDVASIAREQKVVLTHEDIEGVLSSIEDAHDNWDDVVAEAIHTFLEEKGGE